MLDTEDLPFTVQLWSENELSIERQLAAAASLSMGRATFDMAAVSHPERMITLRGPGANEVHAPPPKTEPRLMKVHARWPSRRVPLVRTV